LKVHSYPAFLKDTKILPESEATNIKQIASVDIDKDLNSQKAYHTSK
jgi:hypothetical protein